MGNFEAFDSELKRVKSQRDGLKSALENLIDAMDAEAKAANNMENARDHYSSGYVLESKLHLRAMTVLISRQRLACALLRDLDNERSNELPDTNSTTTKYCHE